MLLVCSEFVVQLQCKCGGGKQTRRATCVDARGNKVNERYCNNRELITERQCHTRECARWVSQDWTGVSGILLKRFSNIFRWEINHGLSISQTKKETKLLAIVAC